MLKIIFFTIFILIMILIRNKYTEKFGNLCNVPYRISESCFIDKYHNCLFSLSDKNKCQKLAEIECIPPPTVSSFYGGKISCV